MKRAVFVCDTDEIGSQHLGLTRLPSPDSPSTTRADQWFDFNENNYTIDEVERRLIIEAIRHCHGNVTMAAKLIGLNRGAASVSNRATRHRCGRRRGGTVRGRLSHVVAAVPFLALATTTLGTTKRTYFDLANDARVRRTDLGADGALGDGAVLPDLISITSGGWSPASPATDPYTGVWVESEGADILRIDIVFEGLINPPGTLGLGPTIYDPFAFGPSPLYGSIEFDIDDENDTGGECSGAANFMYLASVGRLGEVPGTSIEERMAREGEDLDSSFASEPQYERNGARLCVAILRVRECHRYQ